MCERRNVGKRYPESGRRRGATSRSSPALLIISTSGRRACGCAERKLQRVVPSAGRRRSCVTKKECVCVWENAGDGGEICQALPTEAHGSRMHVT